MGLVFFTGFILRCANTHMPLVHAPYTTAPLGLPSPPFFSVTVTPDIRDDFLFPFGLQGPSSALEITSKPSLRRSVVCVRLSHKPFFETASKGWRCPSPNYGKQKESLGVCEREAGRAGVHERDGRPGRSKGDGNPHSIQSMNLQRSRKTAYRRGGRRYGICHLHPLGTLCKKPRREFRFR